MHFRALNIIFIYIKPTLLYSKSYLFVEKGVGEIIIWKAPFYDLFPYEMLAGSAQPLSMSRLGSKISH